ncbi:GNAT family N-acetyltransferase [Streptomyces sp. NPDC006208]|uniref:GNAT family N-acetyltransferase n=1 Tax=Streptomyces sp. NPDC006208 TaxID=3156734 RepID=UPI0033A10E97
MKATPLGAARLELLPLRVEHADEMAVALSDASLHTFIGGTPAMEQELRVRYERMVTGSPDPAVSWCNWVLRLRDEARLVGTVQATIGPSGEGTEAEIAWVVGVPWQRRGFATEAAQRLVVWLEQLPVQSLVAHIHPDHQASASIASAIGLSPTGQWQDGEVRWERAVTVRPRRRDEGHP